MHATQRGEALSADTELSLKRSLVHPTDLPCALRPRTLEFGHSEHRDGNAPQCASRGGDDQVLLVCKRAEEKHRVYPKDVLSCGFRAVQWREAIVSRLVRFTLAPTDVTDGDSIRDYMTLPSLFLAANIADRCLKRGCGATTCYKLVAATVLFTASKYVDSSSNFKASEFHEVGHLWTWQDIVAHEAEVLFAIAFHLSVPTSLDFAARFLALAPESLDARHEVLVHYLLTLTLFDVDVLHFAPSLIAAAAICLARGACGATDAWSDDLRVHSGYASEELAPAMSVVCALQGRADADPPLTRVRSIFSSARHFGVSKIALPCVLGARVQT